MTLTFDQAVALDATDLTLLVGGVASPASLVVTPTDASNTQYVVTFAGAGVTAGSLADGRYRLTLKGRSSATPPAWA